MGDERSTSSARVVQTIAPAMAGIGLSIGLLLWLAQPSAAIVGGGFWPSRDVLEQLVLVGLPGRECSGTLIARDLALTAAHCTRAAGEYHVKRLDPNHRSFIDYPADQIERHPRFNVDEEKPNRSFDIALVHLREAVPEPFVSVFVASRTTIRTGDELAIAGFGISTLKEGKPQRSIRMAKLYVGGALWTPYGRPVQQYFSLYDPGADPTTGGVGTCGGDSGGPVFYITGVSYLLVGVIVAGRGATGTTKCGGESYAVAIAPHLAWLNETAHKLGSALP